MTMVSVIMSTYNTEETLLKQAIDSILNQTFKDFEFIIVNDGSTLDQLKVINSFRDNRIKIINNKKNLGLPKSLNTAIEQAKGKYIARMDSDDISFPERLEKQVRYLEENEEIDIIGSFAKFIGESKKFSLTPMTSYKYVKVMLLTGTTLLHPTVMMRKEFLVTHNLRYNENFRYAQDFELWSRCAEKGKVEILPEVLLYLRKHKKQVSTQKKYSQKEYAKEILKRQLESFGVEYNNTEFKVHCMISGLDELDLNRIEEIEKWLLKLIRQNNRTNKYDKYIFKKVLFNKLFNRYFKLPYSRKELFTYIYQNKGLRNILINSFNIFSGIKRMKYILSNTMKLKFK